MKFNFLLHGPGICAIFTASSRLLSAARPFDKRAVLYIAMCVCVFYEVFARIYAGGGDFFVNYR